MSTARYSVLGMYPFPTLRGAWDDVYAAAATHVDGAPAALSWDRDVHHSWLDPDLALGMACGWPLLDELRERVRVVGTFACSQPEGVSYRYRSVIVTAGVHDLHQMIAEPARYCAALNATGSLSGNISLLAVFGLGLAWPGAVVLTGAHLASIEAVRSGAADVAAIDGMTWLYQQRDAPGALHGLRVIGFGPTVPCLPLIVPAATPDADVDAWRAAFAAVVRDPRAEPALRRLMIGGFVPLDASDYSAALAELVAHHLQPA